MDIAIGSLNPVKRAATVGAFALVFPDTSLNVTATDVLSGVDDQPMSGETTVRGALNRAEAVAHQSTVAYAVGIEGGIITLDVKGQHHSLEQTWAAVVDCATGQSQVASGPSYPIPGHVIELVTAGYNLSDAMAQSYGTKDLGKHAGYNGWLSNNHYDRTASSQMAVMLALSLHVKSA